MTTAFPTGLDDFSNPTPDQPLPGHAQKHTDLNDAVEALEAKIGVDDSAVTSSLDYRVNSLEAAVSAGLTNPVDYIDFETALVSPPARQTGRIFWDNADGNKTLSLYMEGDNATLQIGEESYYRIKATSAITEGQVIMFSGSVGASGALMGAPATGLTAETASYVMGIATESIAANGWGYVTHFGLVRGIDTTGGAETWVDGQILYLDPNVPGGLTKTVPTSPNPKVQVCAVVYAASNGSVFVRPSFGGKLGQYEGDVDIVSPVAGDLLQYDGDEWVNIPASSIVPDISTKQDTLVSGTNIKTVNGNSLLGSGNLVISGGSGGLTHTVTEISTGATPVSSVSVTITDAAISTSSNLLVSVYPQATSSNSLADHLHAAASWNMIAVPGTGNLTVYIDAMADLFFGNFNIRYSY